MSLWKLDFEVQNEEIELYPIGNEKDWYLSQVRDHQGHLCSSQGNLLETC